MKKILVIITAVFFASMLFLSLFSRDIHNSGLPHISASRVQRAQFPFEYTDESGETLVGTESKLAITKEQFEHGVYVLYKAEKNGQVRDFIRRAAIETGRENGGFVEVISGLSHGDKIVVSSDRELCEGEVVVRD